MPKTSAELKAQAKEQLKGRWEQIIVATLVAMVISIGMSGVLNLVGKKIPFISLLSILVSGPLSLGMSSYMLKFIKYQEVEISEVFSGFSRFGDSVLLTVLMSILIFLWALPFYIIFIVIVVAMLMTTGVSMVSFSMAPILASPLFIVLILVMIAMIAVITIKALSYSMAYYILAENLDMSASDALKWSKKITQGHKGRMFYVGLSFIGWGILATIPICVGYLWFIPYVNTTYTNLYEDLKLLSPEYYAIASGSSYPSDSSDPVSGDSMDENNNN